MADLSDREYDYCPSSSPFVWSDDIVENQRTILKTRCKRWDCPYCSQVNKLQHRLRVYHGLSKLENQGHKFAFVTITSHKDLKDTVSCYRVFQKAWSKLSTRYRREVYKITGLSAEYVYIPELHKDNRLHWHGVFSGQLPKRFWKNNCAECGLGYMADSSNLDNISQATNYVTKYISKNVGQSIDIERFRRINYSRGFPKNEPAKTDSNWNVLKQQEAIATLIESAWKLDLTVTLNKQLIEEIIYTA